MAKFQITYDYVNSYVVTLEAPDEETAWEMFHQGKGLSAPELVYEEMLDNSDIEELED